MSRLVLRIKYSYNFMSDLVLAYMPSIVHSKHVMNLWCTRAGLYAIHRAFAACYQFIMHSRNWNGKRNFVHVMQFRSLDVYSEFKSVALRGISNSNTSNHHETKRKFLQKIFQQRSQNWNGDSARTWNCFKYLGLHLWTMIYGVIAQQGYNGLLYYFLIIWSFPQMTIAVIFLTISGHTACYLQQWYIRC